MIWQESIGNKYLMLWKAYDFKSNSFANGYLAGHAPDAYIAKFMYLPKIPRMIRTYRKELLVGVGICR